MLETLSLGARAALASAVVHGTIAAAVVSQLLPAAPGAQVSPVVFVDVQNDVTPFLPPPPPPLPPPERQSVMPFPRASLDSRAQPEVASPGPQPTAPTSPAPVTNEVMAAPAVADAPATSLPVFRMSMGGGAMTGSAPATGAGARTAEAEIVDESSASALADRLYGPSPVYPRDAQAARIEGDVPLLLLVDTTGHVADVRVQRRAGYGLDEAAVAAAREWTFKPRMQGGRAIAVRVAWTMQFRLD
jgi:protein TonB